MSFTKLSSNSCAVGFWSFRIVRCPFKNHSRDLKRFDEDYHLIAMLISVFHQMRIRDITHYLFITYGRCFALIVNINQQNLVTNLPIINFDCNQLNSFLKSSVTNIRQRYTVTEKSRVLKPSKMLQCNDGKVLFINSLKVTKDSEKRLENIAPTRILPV